MKQANADKQSLWREGSSANINLSKGNVAWDKSIGNSSTFFILLWNFLYSSAMRNNFFGYPKPFSARISQENDF
jgi:hypothetical protein